MSCLNINCDFLLASPFQNSWGILRLIGLVIEEMKNQKIKIPVKQEFSAGGVVYKKIHDSRFKNQEQVVWLVGKHSGYHRWVLPKGLIEPGEKGVETAVRETEEEMGVRARIINPKPIHREQYWFVAEFKESDEGKKVDDKTKSIEASKKSKGKIKPIRRVAVYKEDPKFSESEGKKYRVFKTVTFYLMEYESGSPENHDFEMSEAGWYEFEEAQKKLDFEGERRALEKAREMLENG